MTAAPEDPADLLARWGIPAKARLSRTLHGYNNRTFAVEHGERRWVLRISQNLSAAQVRSEHRLLGRLSGAGLPFAVPEPVPMVAGGTVAETAAGPAALCRWLHGVRPDLAGQRELERLGRAFGVLDEALRQVPPQDAPQDWRGDPLLVHPGAADIGGLCRELVAAGVSGRQAAQLRTAASAVAAWWPGAVGQLPVQVVHGDMAASNVLVDERTGQVNAVLDFEAAGAAFRVEELAAGLLQCGALPGPRWQRRTAALVRGYASAGRLCPAELEAVPDLLICRCVGSVLWRARRWRRGRERLSGVIERLDRLETTRQWLWAHGELLRSLLAAAGR